MPTCLIGLGANLGDRQQTLTRAVDLLGESIDVRLLRISQWYETRPVGGPTDQPAFLNGAATIETTLAPQALLAVLQQIETRLGRQPRERWSARPIDLDLLLYDDLVQQTAALVVPHPRMSWRRFVLEPAAEIAGAMVHPRLGWTVARLLDHLDSTPWYMAVTGPAASANTRFAWRVADACSAELLSDSPPPAGMRFPTDPSGPCLPVALECVRAGTRLPVALECVRRRSRLLAAGHPRWSESTRPVLSDFWFGESRALASCWLSAHELPMLLARCRQLAPRVARPRLVVLLDAPSRRHHVDEPWRQALARQLRRVDVGPVLRLTDPQSPEALDEAVAAIQAMK